MASGHNLRKNTFVYLIGNYVPQIVGSKLPSQYQVLKFLFFNMREVNLNSREN